MTPRRSRYLRHRFPPDIISHAVWLYYRYCLSFRDVEDLLAERGVIVSYETVRQWCRKFGPNYARRLKRRQDRLGDTWFLDEVFVTINVSSEASFDERARDRRVDIALAVDEDPTDSSSPHSRWVAETQSVFCVAPRRDGAGVRPTDHRRDGRQKTGWTKLQRDPSMGIRSSEGCRGYDCGPGGGTRACGRRSTRRVARARVAVWGGERIGRMPARAHDS